MSARKVIINYKNHKTQMVKGNQAGRQPQDYSLDSDSEGKELISRSPSPSEEDSEIKYYEERRYRRLPRS